jgi:Fe-S oxidoreductase
MALFGLGSKETLFFPGCFSEAHLKDKIENYEKILKKLKIGFWKTQKIACCGGILEESGYEKQLRKLAKENSSFLNEKETKKIITICTKCQETLKTYKSLTPDWNIEAEFILITILNAIKENPDAIKNIMREEVYYYDSCILGRSLKIIEEPRQLLNLVGYTVLELPNNKEESICCGSCGLLPNTHSELAEDICLDFFKMLKRRNIKKVVTADLMAYKFLRDVKRKLNIQEIEVLEFSEIICGALGIKLSEVGE